MSTSTTQTTNEPTGRETSPRQLSKPEPSAANTHRPPLSPETRRTLVFVLAAVVCLTVTGFVEWSSRPRAIQEFGRVGQPFYSDFTDPTQATALDVFVFDPDDVRPLDFRVQRLDNGRWVIPSHHDYPADAEEQLAKTAASIIGITRGAMVTRWAADHPQYGVVNPRQDTLSVGDVEGVGKRIVLRGEDDTVLADYIIGRQVEGESDQFYVRHPEEDEVYIAKLDIDLSTKFTDWIETDLLDIDSWDVTELTVNDYSFDELQGSITEQHISSFHRENSGDPWTLDGLDEATEEINEDALRETVTALADLSIAGVRPKHKGLTPDLKLDRQALRSQHDVERLQTDLLTRGFLLQPGEHGDQENLVLMAREGELHAATNEGLLYRLYFGRAFTGNQEELEIGLSSSSANDANGDESSNNESSSDASTDTGNTEESSATQTPDEASSDENPKENGEDGKESENADSGKQDSGKPGRYVFVRVEFDKTYLGDAPTKPVAPQRPPELQESTGEPGEVNETENPDAETVDSVDDDASEVNEEDSAETAAKSEDDPLAEIREAYEQAKQEYDDALEQYERDLKQYEQRIDDGQKKADELNRRFADWYYVIPGESFEKLRLTRSDLVKAKEPSDEEESTNGDSSEQSTSDDNNTSDENDSEEEIIDQDSAGRDASDVIEAAQVSNSEDVEEDEVVGNEDRP